MVTPFKAFAAKEHLLELPYLILADTAEFIKIAIIPKSEKLCSDQPVSPGQINKIQLLIYGQTIQSICCKGTFAGTALSYFSGHR